MSPRRSCRSRHRAEIELRQPARVAQALDDALAHLGGGLSRERDRENVVGIDAGAQQIDVAIDQDARLAGAGRRLEHDVLGRDRRRTRARRDGRWPLELETLALHDLSSSSNGSLGSDVTNVVLPAHAAKLQVSQR